MKQRLICLLLALAVLGAFLVSLENLEAGQKAEGKRTLEEAVRNAAVACYAAEGAYPPDIGYLREYYGLTFDEDSYAIHYDFRASNLMPEITVLEK